MGPKNMTVERVYQEIYRASLYAADVPKSRKLEDIRETLAAWYGVPADMVELDWDGQELSARIYLQKVEDVQLSFHLTPEETGRIGQ